jgi:hypothetical protein
MTRETKVGLSIAATVFAVVGGALAYKLYFLTPGTGGLAQSTSAFVAEPQVCSGTFGIFQCSDAFFPVATGLIFPT